MTLSVLNLNYANSRLCTSLNLLTVTKLATSLDLTLC